jgi:molybdopterin converting factor small subunit
MTTIKTVHEAQERNGMFEDLTRLEEIGVSILELANEAETLVARLTKKLPNKNERERIRACADIYWLAALRHACDDERDPCDALGKTLRETREDIERALGM